MVSWFCFPLEYRSSSAYLVATSSASSSSTRWRRCGFCLAGSPAQSLCWGFRSPWSRCSSGAPSRSIERLGGARWGWRWRSTFLSLRVALMLAWLNYVIGARVPLTIVSTLAIVPSVTEGRATAATPISEFSGAISSAPAIIPSSADGAETEEANRRPGWRSERRSSWTSWSSMSFKLCRVISLPAWDSRGRRRIMIRFWILEEQYGFHRHGRQNWPRAETILLRQETQWLSGWVNADPAEKLTALSNNERGLKVWQLTYHDDYWY